MISFLERPIEGEWTYLRLDATYLKVREDRRVVSGAAINATGVNTDGRREILGLGLGPSEAAVFWLDFLRGLERRGHDAQALARVLRRQAVRRLHD